MAGDLLLGIDIGTGSLKLALIDSDARLVAKRSAGYDILHPEPGWAEIDAENLWSVFVREMGELFADYDAGAVRGIGIACLCPGLIAYDRKGRIIQNPIIYSDSRSVAEAEYIKSVMPPEDFFAMTANTPMSGAMSATSILWLKNNRPEIYQKAAGFGHINTLFCLKMTGEAVIDRSNASYTGLFDTAGTRDFHPFLCEKIGVAYEKLPKVIGSDETAGGLCNEELIALGLRRGVPVVAGGGDSACAALAAGVVKSNDVCESVGTTNVLTICADKPRFSRAFINRCHVVDGVWIYQAVISHAGSSILWFKDTLCPEMEQQAVKHGRNALAIMDEEAEQSRPGAGGVVFLPYMQGERSPVWDTNARGVFFGLSLGTNRADMIRAILESCGYGQRQLIAIAEETTGQAFDSIVSLGGGAKSKVWAQIRADITGKDIHILQIGDAAPVGAALLAGVGAGIFSDAASAANKLEPRTFTQIQSSGENKRVYDQCFSVYHELYPRVKDLFQKNSAL